MKRIRRQHACSLLLVFALGLALPAHPRGRSGEPAGAADSQAAAKETTALPAPSIPFDTGILEGSFRFFNVQGQKARPGGADFPGVGECVYKPSGVSLVNKTRPNSLFLPEWILRPKGPRDGTLWRRAFFIQPEPIAQGVRVRYPDGDLAEAGLRCTLEYRAVKDMLLLDAYIEATRTHQDLEFLFASYIPNRLNATYAPAKTQGGVEWKLIPNRVTPWKSAYSISSSPETRRWRRDGRVGDAKELGDWSQVYDADWPFAAPILVAIEEASGLAAVHFVDGNCTALVGQYHPNDTAHDFTWGWPTLKLGRKVHARAALWITQLPGTHEQRMQRVYEKYQQWRRSWAR